jgi:hypothetical protein
MGVGKIIGVDVPPLAAGESGKIWARPAAGSSGGDRHRTPSHESEEVVEAVVAGELAQGPRHERPRLLFSHLHREPHLRTHVQAARQQEIRRARVNVGKEMCLLNRRAD